MSKNLHADAAASPGVMGGVKGRPGRPKGLPKTGGRRKGTVNRATTLGRAFIVKKSSALPFLCDVSAGRKVRVGDPEAPGRKIEVYPDFGQRLKAASVLAPMLVPIMKSTELTGADGEALPLLTLVQRIIVEPPADAPPVVVDALDAPEAPDAPERHEAAPAPINGRTMRQLERRSRLPGAAPLSEQVQLHNDNQAARAAQRRRKS